MAYSITCHAIARGQSFPTATFPEFWMTMLLFICVRDELASDRDDDDDDDGILVLAFVVFIFIYTFKLKDLP